MKKKESEDSRQDSTKTSASNEQVTAWKQVTQDLGLRRKVEVFDAVSIGLNPSAVVFLLVAYWRNDGLVEISPELPSLIRDIFFLKLFVIDFVFE